MTARKKRRLRTSRRALTPTSRPVASTATSLARASTAATGLGVLAVAAALAVQFHLLPLGLSPHESTALRIAGIGLVIAGFVLGRTRGVAR